MDVAIGAGIASSHTQRSEAKHTIQYSKAQQEHGKEMTLTEGRYE